MRNKLTMQGLRSMKQLGGCFLLLVVFVLQVQTTPLEKREFPCTPYRTCLYPTQYCDGEICQSCNSTCGRELSRVPATCIDLCSSWRKATPTTTTIAAAISTTTLEAITGRQRDENRLSSNLVFYVVILIILFGAAISGWVCKGRIRNGITVVNQTFRKRNDNDDEETGTTKMLHNPQDEKHARYHGGDKSDPINDHMADKA